MSGFKARAQPTYGPDADVPQYERKVGVEAKNFTKGEDDVANFWISSREVLPGVRGLPTRDTSLDLNAQQYAEWCKYWGAKPDRSQLGDHSEAKPDLSPSKKLLETVKVTDDERQLRHDCDENMRWFRNHQNKKPEKVEIREQARRAHSVMDLTAIAKGERDGSLILNFNKFGSLNQASRPRRLEYTRDPCKVWTPRVRPITPAPLDIRTRVGKTVQVEMPSKFDRDPYNPNRKQLHSAVFGFLGGNTKENVGITGSMQIKDIEASAQYDRFSLIQDDRRMHARRKAHPKECYVSPLTTMQEVGWHANDKETYIPICGPSPAVHDEKLGLPRIALAGGCPRRLASTMSKFVDNLLLTRKGCNPF